MTYQANPFIFDRIASGNHFCNREKEIKELLGDIKSSHNVIIFSQRRYGKTSLINQVLNLAKLDGILTIYVDIYHILWENIRPGSSVTETDLKNAIDLTAVPRQDMKVSGSFCHFVRNRL